MGPRSSDAVMRTLLMDGSNSPVEEDRLSSSMSTLLGGLGRRLRDRRPAEGWATPTPSRGTARSSSSVSSASVVVDPRPADDEQLKREEKLFFQREPIIWP